MSAEITMFPVHPESKVDSPGAPPPKHLGGTQDAEGDILLVTMCALLPFSMYGAVVLGGDIMRLVLAW